MSDGLVQETYEYMLAGARGALQKGQSFMPFGAGIRLGGERIHVNLDAEAQAKDVQDYIAALVGALRKDRALTCAGLCFDGAVAMENGDSVPAICMHIEINGGESLEAFVPYVREPGGLAIMEPIFAPTDPEIFRHR